MTGKPFCRYKPSSFRLAQAIETGSSITHDNNHVRAGLGVAARMGVELVVATCLGGGAGYWADQHWHTLPWLTIFGLALGTAAGVRNVMRIADQMDRDPRFGGVNPGVNEKPGADAPGADKSESDQ